MWATPGAGKSLIPLQACKLISAGLADAICWVSPRNALQYQAEKNFIDPVFREMLGHNFTIRASTNEHDPCRGHNGFVTTYQAVAADKKGWLEHEFAQKRYIIVLDEVHHLEEGGLWHEAIAPLVKRSRFLIAMTGTVERGDGKKIAYTPYRDIGDEVMPDFTNTDSFRYIEYSRSTALAEKSILPMKFVFHDGKASWITPLGKMRRVNSFYNAKKEVTSAIYTALDTEFANGLLSEGAEHWADHRQNKNPGAKLLVVTATIKHAKKAVEHLNSSGFTNVKIATSHESKSAVEAIKEFKYGSLDILVTIAMAYEGLSVKPITHLICLTHIRSRPWLEQMLARAVRIDPDAGPYHKQAAYIFAPDDPLIRGVVNKIRSEQLPYLKEALEKNAPEQMELFDDVPDEPGKEFKPYGITTLGSEVTMSKKFSLDGGNFSGLKTFEIKAPVKKIVELTPKEAEKKIRKDIAHHVNLYGFKNRYDPRALNGELFHYFKKARKDMTYPELEKVMEYIKTKYPLEGPSRGCGKARVSTRVVPYKTY